MAETRFQKFVDEWIAAQGIDRESPDYNPNNWAIQLACKWSYGKPEQVWRLIVAVFERDVSDEVLMMVGCSPLEELLCNWGPEYIDKVEELARNDERFLKSLRCVWGWTRMPQPIWARLIALTAERYCSFCSRSREESTLISSSRVSVCAKCLANFNNRLLDAAFIGEQEDRYACCYCEKQPAQCEKLIRNGGTCICNECVMRISEKAET